ncbi:MAG: DUF1772 domain-containing protein, partial [Chloroflexi bacterium]|nr:DUF1772 domain-containing protein [Chloroflexota bacterium]
RLVNLILAGTLTGNEVGSLVTVHPALDSLPPRAHLRAEQAVTRRYGRIQPVFMSTTVASFLPVLALTRNRGSAPFYCSLAGMLCYIAMLAITLTANLPINKRLLELSPDATPGEEFRELRARWNRLHTARNLLNLTGLILAVLGALSKSD